MEYIMNRYLRRWFANTFGPPLLTLTYSLIVRYYLCVPPVNGVIDPPLISAGFVYYAWLIFSIFALDWAKSALAGFEAWALMDPRFAPPTALHLMWHTDRAWGSVSGWRDAIVPLCMGVRHRFFKQPTRRVARGPAGLWWFLAFSSSLFYAAIPLSSLTMEIEPAFKRSTRTISILGGNETTFDTGISNVVSEQANNRWRSGNPTTPDSETVLYSPVGVGNGSDEYYWHTIQDVCRHDSINASSPARKITFFSGPQVDKRVHGSAWGLLTSLSCSIISPVDQRFELLKVYDIDNWTAAGLRSDDYGKDFFNQGAGLTPSFFDNGTSFGVSYAYLVASDMTTEGGREYMNAEAFPRNGSLEIVLWQAYRSPYFADAIYDSLLSHPAVISSVWKDQDTAYLGFGVRCSVDSCTGTADLHVERRSYSNFTARASSPLNISLISYNGLNSNPGIMALQSIVFAGFTTAVPNVMAPPTCVDGGGLSSVTCNSWYGANLATGGSPYLVQGKEPDPHTQLHTITPARFILAVHKLFGEATIAMMARGAGAWEGELYGLDPTTALVPGKVPWSIVLTLLILWTAVTSIPSLWVFGRKRWADTLSGFDMFRFGAEWKEAVWQFEENEFEKCPILLEVPGMIGDMEANVMDTGFIGLSKDEARKNGSFVFARDAVI
ncbi:hypothetical protein D6D20_07654 [Aureobasidium pullulans]|uniref:Uncharacterized protein n=1 Tax=Aureobasidium pullulans TaxID=5580 RepID=A0A4S8YY84_AURPU|nr:hypothetical protein D6D20_07654 [Aureobasidium pullulans]